MGFAEVTVLKKDRDCVEVIRRRHRGTQTAHSTLNLTARQSGRDLLIGNVDLFQLALSFRRFDSFLQQQQNKHIKMLPHAHQHRRTRAIS